MKALPRLLPLLILSFFLSACPTPSSPDFSLALSPSTLSFDSVNTSKSSNLSINKSGDFKDAVTFRVQNAPTGIEATLSNVTTDSATVNVKLTQALAAQDYTVTLAGTSGSLNKTIELTVRVGQVSNPNLSVPTGFNASLDGNDKVLLGWQAVENASEYVLERSSDGNNYSSLATASTTSYTDSGVSVDNRYHYRIKAKNASQESVFSAAAVVDIKAVAANEDTVIVVGEQDSKDVALQIPQGFFKSNSNVIVSSNPQNPTHYIDEVTLAGKQASFSFTGSNINPNSQAAIQVNIALNPQTIKGKSLESLALTDGDQMLLDVHIRGEDANGQKYYTNFLDIGTFQNNNALVGAGSVNYPVAILNPPIINPTYPIPPESSSKSCFELTTCHISIQTVIYYNSSNTPYNPFKTRNFLYRINTPLFLNNDFRRNVSNHCASADQSKLYENIVTQQVAELMDSDSVIDDGRMPLVLVHGWLQLEYLAAFTSSTIDVLNAKSTKQDVELLIQARNPITKVHAANRLSKIPRQIADFTSLTPEVCYWLGFYKYVAMHPSLSQHFEIYAFPYNSVNVRVADNARTLARSIKNVFGERKITILAHSMGGLVSQDYLNNYDNHVDRLITLGTPFRGSPLLRCTKVDNSTGYCLKAAVNNEFVDKLGKISDNPFQNIGETAVNLGILGIKNIIINNLLDAKNFPATLDLAWDAPLGNSVVGNNYLRNLNGLGTNGASNRYNRNTAYFGLADFHVVDNQLPYYTNTEGGLSACTITDIADGYQNHDSVSCGMDFFGALFIKGRATYNGVAYFRALSDGIVPMESATVSLERSSRGTSGTNYWQANSIGASYSNALIPDTRFVRLNHVQFMSGRVTPTDFITGDTLFHNPTSTECQSSLRYTTACSPYFYALVGDLVNQKPNYPPQAVLNSDVKKGTAPLVVNFDGSESRDDSGTISRYVFRFGDGDTSLIDGTESKVSHTYRRAGSYTASLTVYDAKGLHTTTQITIEVGATVKPIADFTFTPAAPVAGQAVTFNAKAHSSDSAVKYGFNFGDGSNSVVNTTGTATHTFAAAGSYNVRLQVEDAKGVKSETKVKVVQVQAATSGKVCKGDFVIDSVDTTGDIAKVQDCNEIRGNLKIYSTNLTDLSALSKLQKVTGYMCIGCFVDNYNKGNVALTNLAGLENISSVKGGLYIGQNPVLTSLAGLKNLSSVGEHLSIWNNATLTSLAGLKNLSSVKGGLYIGQNPALTSLAGLKNLSSVGGNLDIRDNAALTSLAGLENLSSVGKHLSIWNNATLTSLAGLKNLSSIGGDLDIRNNAALTSLAGLEKLSSVGGSLYIRNNAALTNLAGLKNLSSIRGNLYIRNNAALTSLAGLEKLSSIGWLAILSNAALTSLTGIDNLSSVRGTLTINNNAALTSLAGLKNLSSVGGNLDIRDNAALTSLAGLENLSSIRVDLSIWNNVALTSLSGLDNLSSVGGYLSIRNNDALTSLSGLDNLSSVGGHLYIYSNAALTSLAGLEKLKEVKGSRKEIYANPQFDCSPYNQNPPPYFPLTRSTSNKVNCTTQ